MSRCTLRTWLRRGAGTLPALALLVAACDNTRLVTSWRAYDAEPVSPAGQRIATVFITQDEAGRRAGEDALAQELARMGAQGVPSYTILHGVDVTEKNADNTATRDRVKAQFAAAHIDGVVVMRVISAQTVVTGTDGGYWAAPYYGTFWGYWDYGWNSVYAPGYLQTQTQVMSETLVYSLQPEKLLWAGTSETFDPSSVQSAVRHIAHDVTNKMAKQGILVR